MDFFLNHLLWIIVIVIGVILAIAFYESVLATARSARAILGEARKTNAILLAAFGLEEGPPVKGVPRIVKSRKAE